MARITLTNNTNRPVEASIWYSATESYNWVRVAAGQTTDFGRDTQAKNGWSMEIRDPNASSYRNVLQKCRRLRHDAKVTLSDTPGGKRDSWDKYKLTVERRSQTGMGRIDHVVVLMLENRSFDNLLGWLYYDPETKKNVPPLINLPKRKGGPIFHGLDPSFSNPDSSGRNVPVTYGTRRPKSAKRGSTGAEFTVPNVDPQEQFRFMNQQIFGTQNPKAGAEATMQGFVQDYETVEGAEPDQIMECYSPAQTPVLSALAKNFAVCDQWFASAPCQTWPNRSFLHAGTSNGRINNLDGPVDSNKIPPTKYYDINTIFDFLHQVGASWEVYSDAVIPTLTWLQFRDTWHRIPDHLSHFVKRISHFKEEASTGNLPTYAFVEPVFFASPTKSDQHPPHDIRPGEKLIYDIYQAIASGPSWENTLLIITYDEHGGCYDHVPPPPAIPPDNAKPQTPPVPNVRPFRFDRYGVRVPTVVVSPYIEAGTVFRSPLPDAQFDHTSILATLRDWLDPERQTFESIIKSQRVKSAPTLDMLLTRAEPRDAPDIASPPSFKALQAPSGTKLNDIQRALVAAQLGEHGHDSDDPDLINKLNIETYGDADRTLKSLNAAK